MCGGGGLLSGCGLLVISGLSALVVLVSTVCCFGGGRGKRDVGVGGFGSARCWVLREHALSGVLSSVAKECRVVCGGQTALCGGVGGRVAGGLVVL